MGEELKDRYIGHYSALFNPCNAEIIDDYIVIDVL